MISFMSNRQTYYIRAVRCIQPFLSCIHEYPLGVSVFSYPVQNLLGVLTFLIMCPQNALGMFGLYPVSTDIPWVCLTVYPVFTNIPGLCLIFLILYYQHDVLDVSNLSYLLSFIFYSVFPFLSYIYRIS